MEDRTTQISKTCGVSVLKQRDFVIFEGRGRQTRSDVARRKLRKRAAGIHELPQCGKHGLDPSVLLKTAQPRNQVEVHSLDSVVRCGDRSVNAQDVSVEAYCAWTVCAGNRTFFFFLSPTC